MCGIAGFNWTDEAMMKKLCDSFSYRGPDQEGYYSDSFFTLGHKRLSILDPSEQGRQPMSNEDKTIFITFNGEIFNFQELKKELSKYQWKTNTDTEVIIHAYEEYGVDCLKKLSGQFAFALYDSKKKIVLLARDRVGINPLYYYFNEINGMFIFGSELKILLNSGIPKEINLPALHYYFAYGYTPSDQSIMTNAKKLKPAHYLIFDVQNKKIKECRKYWDVEFSEASMSEEDAKAQVLAQLEKSVKSQLVSDVPVGAFLSGGVDSSAVVAFASKYKKNINTFSVKFDDADFDESKYSFKVAKKFKTKHHVVSFSASDVKKLLKKLPVHFDEPFADPSMVPTFLVSSVARKHVTVSLSGDGADELFSGYRAHQYYRILQLQNWYPSILNKPLHSVFRKFSSARFQKIAAFFEIGTLPKELKYARLMSYLSVDELKDITGVNPQNVYESYAQYYSKDYVTTASKSDLHIYLPEDILAKVDRASLANSLESRPPFLDQSMIELACRIPSSLKRKDGEGKYILKKALESVLPKEILYRKKMGFAMPLEKYLKGELKEIVNRYVFNYKKHNYVSQSFIQKLKQQYAQKEWTSTYSRIIWTLLMFNLWWEQWMDSTKIPTKTKNISALEKTGKNI